MKKFIFLMALLFTIPLIAQEQKNTITVIGETDIKVEDQNYTILVALQQILVYEGQTEVEATPLEVVKKNYISKLADLGIDFSRFRRNTYYEFAMSYSENRDSEYYYLKTSNKDDVRKIIQLRLAGTSIANAEIDAVKYSNEQLATLSKLAIDDAKQKADTIARNMGKTIGEIVAVEDKNTRMQYVQSYGLAEIQSYSVTVTYELK